MHSNATAHKKRLITLIQVAKSQLGLEPDLYRSMLKDATGKDSLRAMSLSELEMALEAFKQKGFKPRSKVSKTPANKRLSPKSGKAKLPQVDKIRAVWISMGRHNVIQDCSETALDAYVRRMTQRSQGHGVDATAWLDDARAYSVLESLKNWHKRVLIERIITRGQQVLTQGTGTKPAGYDTIVAQYEDHA